MVESTEYKNPTNLINIISQNVLGVDRPNKPTQAVRRPYMKTVLKNNCPDIICLQEITKEWHEYLLKEFPEKDNWCVFNSKSRFATSSTPIIHRTDKFKCLSRGIFWYADINKETLTEPDIKKRHDMIAEKTKSPPKNGIYEFTDKTGKKKCYYRPTHWVQLELKTTGQIFYIFNTHFPLGNGDGREIAPKNDKRFLAIEILKSQIEAITENKYPYFITGDFNMEPNTSGKEPYKEMLNWASDLALKCIVDKTNNSGTFNGMDFNNDYKPKTRIDFCFGGNNTKEQYCIPFYKVILDKHETLNLTDKEGKTIFYTLTKNKETKIYPPSDHYGINIIVDLK